MRYMILIYSNEKNDPDMSDPEMHRWFDYTASLKTAGVYLAGDALMPTSTATTLRGNGKEILTTDGPFAETKEQLGGYYILKCKDLDEALKWAAEVPNIHRGSAEVRPLVDFE